MRTWFPFLAVFLALTTLSRTNAEVSPFAITNEADFFSQLNLAGPALSQVRLAVEARQWTGAKKAWAEHLSHRTTPRWMWSRRDRPALIRAYDQYFGGLGRYTNAADRVLARDFDLLGVRKQLAHDLEWLHGPIEWTHVLSRFGYWRDMGRAYWATGNPAYAEDFVYLLQNWINSNPVPGKVTNDRGRNGSVWRTLEAGIRGQSWFEAMELFGDAPAFDYEAKYLMTRSLVEHARYLEAWVTTFRAGNWQVCEASGLATIGIMLPELKQAAAWRERGLDYLVQHMEKDVGADGMHWELTPGYHTWVMNQFASISLLTKGNGIQVPGLLERHEKMFEILEVLSRPDRTYPAVGDAGRGQSIGESMGYGALLYGRADFRQLSSGCAEDCLWMFGAGACEKTSALQPVRPDFTSALLPAAKYMVMRTGWEPQDQYLLFDCAPWRGGHSHQDRLQVTVFAGRNLIVDSGMCSYDQPLSRELRKSAAHNVVLIDGREQLQADPRLLAWSADETADFASGMIEAEGLSHQRSVLFVKPGYWIVLDHIVGEGQHELTRLFHFPSGPARADQNAAHTAFPDGMNIRVQPVDDAKLELRTCQIPTGSVTSQEATVAVFHAKVSLPATLCTVLSPYSDVRQLPRITAIDAGGRGEMRLRLDFPDGQRDEVAMAAEPRPLRIGTCQAQSRALCVRKGPVANLNISVPSGIGPERLKTRVLPR